MGIEARAKCLPTILPYSKNKLSSPVALKVMILGSGFILVNLIPKPHSPSIEKIVGGLLHLSKIFLSLM